MTFTPKCWILTLGFVICAALPAVAQDRPDCGAPASTRDGSLAGVRDDLARLVLLLEEIRDQQRADLMIQRINLQAQRQAPMESQLRAAEKNVEALRRELENLKIVQEQAEVALEQELLESTDGPDGPSRDMRAEMELHYERLTDQLEEAELRVRRLEYDLADGRDKIEDLDDLLRDLLD